MSKLTDLLSEMEKAHDGRSKIDRYGWTISDAPGVLEYLSKRRLRVNHEYQRDANEKKILNMASSWSWVACGVIVVARREGAEYVIDGQHRVMAAMRRNDISSLPCLVFDIADVAQEATGFIAANTLRKPVPAIDKFRAMVVSGDECAITVNGIIDELGVSISKSNSTGTGVLKSIAWCLKKAAVDADRLRRVLSISQDIAVADAMYIPERILESMWVLDEKIGLDDHRLRQRIYAKGCRTLLDAANRAAAYFNGSGGSSVWVDGVIDELNKGLQRKFSIK